MEAYKQPILETTNKYKYYTNKSFLYEIHSERVYHLVLAEWGERERKIERA